MEDDKRKPDYDNESRLSGTEQCVYRALAVDREYRVIFSTTTNTTSPGTAPCTKMASGDAKIAAATASGERTNASKLLRSSDPILCRVWVRHDRLAYDLLCAARRAADRIAADPIDSTFEIVQSATRRYFVQKAPDPKGQCDFHSFEKDGSVGQWCFSASLDKCHVKRKRSMVGREGRCQLEHAREVARKRRKVE